MIRFWRYFRWTHCERRLFWIAVFWLCRSKYVIAKGSFKQLKPMLGVDLKNSESIALKGRHCEEQRDAAILNSDKNKLKLMLNSLNRATKLMPFHCQCLVRAIAAQKLCKELKLPSVMHLGVNKKEGELAAHAWVSLDSDVVVGRTVEHYTGVKCFTELNIRH